MTRDEFEIVLQNLAKALSREIALGAIYRSSREFEQAVRQQLTAHGLNVDYDPHPHAFPDISVGNFGIEVKFTEKDTWRSVANSIFEGQRDENVESVYVVFGKMGGEPGVRWRRYEDCVIHVRTSHVPRFEVEMSANESLFDQFGVTYEEFRHQSHEQRMGHVREYARSRLKPGERLWWLEDREEPEHSLPMQVRVYMNLSQHEKRMMRAEAALLCPQVVKSSRSRNKYADAVSYLLTYRGVLCPQARDLFSAGSVALRDSSRRGGNYILRALLDIETEMVAASRYLEGALFVEYWGKDFRCGERIQEWLVRADEYASGWRPSEHLFRELRAPHDGQAPWI